MFFLRRREMCAGSSSRSSEQPSLLFSSKRPALYLIMLVVLMCSSMLDWAPSMLSLSTETVLEKAASSSSSSSSPTARGAKNQTKKNSITPQTSTSSFPRVVLWKEAAALASSLDTKNKRKNSKSRRRRQEFDLPAAGFLNATTFDEEVPGHYYRKGKCELVKDWQKQMHPTCNLVHEVDLFRGVVPANDRHESKIQTTYLSAGGTRETWKVDIPHDELHHHRSINNNTSPTVEQQRRSVAVKTLRLHLDYIWKRVDRQRIDATATEHLTSSPHIIDIYGYCGAAAINEFGEQGSLGEFITSAANNNNNATSSNSSNTTTGDGSGGITSLERLRFARDIAWGLADVHEVDGTEMATMVQHDVKLLNILVTNGKAKISDFNNVHFMSFYGDEPCAFHFGATCGKMDITPLPDECDVKGVKTEMLEVFRLGFIFYFLIYPVHKELPPLQNPPVLPRSIAKSDDPALKALKVAMESAFTVEEKKRPKARAIGDALAKVLSKIERCQESL